MDNERMIKILEDGSVNEVEKLFGSMHKPMMEALPERIRIDFLKIIKEESPSDYFVVINFLLVLHMGNYRILKIK